MKMEDFKMKQNNILNLIMGIILFIIGIALLANPVGGWRSLSHPRHYHDCLRCNYDYLKLQ